MYESYYGFTERPFQLSPDPRFFFATAHHQRALSYLQYGLDQREGFIVITGPIGTGKTTLARSLLDNINESNIVAAQLVTTKLSPEEMLELVIAEFKIAYNGNSKAEMLTAIENFLISLNEQGKRALLLVDEAQNLPAETVEELRMLSNFQLDNKPLIQSFLLGQEELKGIIQAPNMEQFRQRIIASAHLQPLSVEEVKNYINHRISQAGYQKEPLFSDKAFTLIHEKTLGIPRKINIFVDRILLFGFLEELANIDINAIQTVAEEMGIELTGSLNNQQANNSDNNPVVINSTEHVENIKDVLREVEEILETSIKQKIKMARYVDKLLKQKNKQYAQANANANANANNEESS